jgi:hypothetical protein
MTNILGLDFMPIDGLEIRGLLAGIQVSQAYTESGVVWMRAIMRTANVDTGEDAVFTFTTPYSSRITTHWRVADLLYWVISHEVLEGVELHGEAMFDDCQLGQDHVSHMCDRRYVERKVAQTLRRFQEDAAAASFSRRLRFRWPMTVIR